MQRARKATLEQLEPWLEEVRRLGIDGLVEKANGAFYQRRSGILHFHEDADGVYADVKVAGDWTRVQVDRGQGKRRVIALLRTENVTSDRKRPPDAPLATRDSAHSTPGRRRVVERMVCARSPCPIRRSVAAAANV